MPDKTFEARIKNKIDTTAHWIAVDSNNNPTSIVLLDGEIGLERTTTGKVKIKVGDGQHNWSELPYVGEENLIATITIEKISSQNSSEDNTIISCDISISDLLQAINAKKNVQIYLEILNNNTSVKGQAIIVFSNLNAGFIYLTHFTPDTNPAKITMTTIIGNSGTPDNWMLTETILNGATS